MDIAGEKLNGHKCLFNILKPSWGFFFFLVQCWELFLMLCEFKASAYHKAAVSDFKIDF